VNGTMRRIQYTVLGLAVLLALSACSHIVYVETQTGEFAGSLDVHWIKPDKFLYIPNKDDPLRFITSKRTFQAEKMYTDGGRFHGYFGAYPDILHGVTARHTSFTTGYLRPIIAIFLTTETSPFRTLHACLPKVLKRSWKPTWHPLTKLPCG
jgi:hypothetical protein